MSNQNENGCAGCLYVIIALFVVGLLVTYWQFVLTFVLGFFVLCFIFNIISYVWSSLFGSKYTHTYHPVTTKFNGNNDSYASPVYTIDTKADAIDQSSASKTTKPNQKSSNLVKKDSPKTEIEMTKNSSNKGKLVKKNIQTNLAKDIDLNIKDKKIKSVKYTKTTIEEVVYEIDTND
ncbi:hypothetical protein [Cyanobacterium sp. Dongsha4]|uniref:hypothetical protein n=1 Tax=Cyanobacterium sp. DS4 TaxID=2878255 RepID=UPI002E8208E5|nr:hypothetical protein [Cyanobacterium sp. Dongsha4]WVL00435.1 hypothetical protein Dongsha4_17585 [Cyanobacterium sp. Dongsha4]